jgi:hypothetical protein
MTRCLIYIDEEPRARALYGRRLQQCIGDEVAVVSIDPEQALDAMVKTIEDSANLVSVVIDQKLTAAGTAGYLGTDLVEKLRLSDHLMPIYILTNYVGDVDVNLGGIEYVLSKDDLSSTEKLATIGTRIRRHINIFQQILGKRELRFEELLRKRFGSELTDLEIAEYTELKYQREKKGLASSFIDNDLLTKKIEVAEAKLQEIEIMLKK